MNDLVFWKLGPVGTKILHKIEEKRIQIKDELGSGVLLTNNSDTLAREYARKIGRLEGLNFLEELITNERDNDEDGE